MLCGAYEETCRVPVPRVLRWVEEGLGPPHAVYLTEMMWGWKASIPPFRDLPGGPRSTGLGK